MENKDLNNKLSEIISSKDKNHSEETDQNQVTIKVLDGLFEHAEVVNKKFVTSDGRQLLKEVRFEN